MALQHRAAVLQRCVQSGLLHTSHSGTCCLLWLTSFRLVQVVDLTGSRDFLTKDSTEEVLKAMLVPGSAVRKVRSLSWSHAYPQPSSRRASASAQQTPFKAGCAMQTAGSVACALAPELALPPCCLSQIKLSTKSFGRDAARVAADAIRNCSGTLADADISDIIAGRPVRSAPRSWKGCA